MADYRIQCFESKNNVLSLKQQYKETLSTETCAHVPGDDVRPHKVVLFVVVHILTMRMLTNLQSYSQELSKDHEFRPWHISIHTSPSFRLVLVPTEALPACFAARNQGKT